MIPLLLTGHRDKVSKFSRPELKKQNTFFINHQFIKLRFLQNNKFQKFILQCLSKIDIDFSKRRNVLKTMFHTILLLIFLQSSLHRPFSRLLSIEYPHSP